MLYPLSYEGGDAFVLVRALFSTVALARLHARSWYVAAWPRPTPTGLTASVLVTGSR
jgi:hypothetical protein